MNFRQLIQRLYDECVTIDFGRVEGLLNEFTKPIADESVDDIASQARWKYMLSGRIREVVHDMRKNGIKNLLKRFYDA